MTSSSAPAHDTTSQTATAVLPRPPRGARAWGRAHGSVPALAISEIAARHDSLVVAVATSVHEAATLEAEIGFFSGGELPVFHFPDWETLPYDLFSPHQDIVSQRLRTLDWLPTARRGVLVVPVSTLLQRVVPAEYLAGHVLDLERGQQLTIESLRQRLERGGYRHVSQVREHGEYAVRGALVDLFPMGRETPLRVDFFDDEIDSIRTFDPETQISDEHVDRIHMLPAREFPLTEPGIERFRRAFREAFAAESRNSPIYRDVSSGVAPAGLEYYLPLFFDSMATLFDHLPGQARYFLLDGAEHAAERCRDQVEQRYEQRCHDLERPILPPDSLYMTPDELRERLATHHPVDLSARERTDDEAGARAWNLPAELPPPLPMQPRAENPLMQLDGFLAQHQGRVLFTAESAGRREALFETLWHHGVRPKQLHAWQDFLADEAEVAITSAPLNSGLLLRPEGGPGLAVITEQQLMGERARQQRRQRKRTTRDADSVVANLAELSIGSPVVHVDHGVGRYQGLTTLQLGPVEQEFLTLEYADNDKLYVPVASLHLISRYTGADADTAPLHRLGSEQWQRARKKAAQKAYDVAAELLDVQARRQARGRDPFRVDTDDYARFAADFPFEETPDQQQAIDAVLADMRAPQPMDRVVCGDVGFGKTEVAMRAAFAAVDEGRQVSILVPTTLLAQQHDQNFRDRFADWPVRIESLSRLRSQAEQKKALEAAAEGKVDILIGTHRLLQKDVKFKNLGLVIVDEEHRFGVRDKERLKKLRAEVDLLTLTATPIPRTLNMSLAGLRDLSIIATPPAERHAIKTLVSEWEDTLIREACERELARGGQIYFVHNEVRSIERIAELVREIVPSATVRVAHGQMREQQLEQTMLDFYHQRFNVLVCTTIIESGIDVPTANTVVINRADRMGMAQLHQIRGRVGRSHHRAYAYLLAPPRTSMTADAEKRLEAIESLEELGVGFTLASHDLEIRGAGELLGEDQSGQIQEVGFTLYQELLERATKALKAGETPDTDKPLDDVAEVDLHLAALLPADYVPDVHERLILYKRIAGAATRAELDELKVEVIDRFGTLPEAGQNLFRVSAIRIDCAALGIQRLDASGDGGRLNFREQPRIDLGVLVTIVQAEPNVYRFDGANGLRFAATMETAEDRIAFVEALLARLAGSSGQAAASNA
ncbi:MAG: transcription-repair coupling factor [Halofilum sp. (in: g-proteobacteria)]